MYHPNQRAADGLQWMLRKLGLKARYYVDSTNPFSAPFFNYYMIPYVTMFKNSVNISVDLVGQGAVNDDAQ